jgi:hypothetical protein
MRTELWQLLAVQHKRCLQGCESSLQGCCSLPGGVVKGLLVAVMDGVVLVVPLEKQVGQGKVTRHWHETDHYQQK